MKPIALLGLLALTGCVPKVETTAHVFHHNKVPYILCKNVINLQTTNRQQALATLEPCRKVIEANTKP
jgi:hypothetical protein